MYSIPKLPLDNFDWLSWRIGKDIWTKLRIHPRWFAIVDNKELFRKYAVGYIQGYRLFCRPELNEIAVMFLIDDKFGWTHLRAKEFEELFNVE